MHDLAHVHDALGALPAAEAALVAGSLTWTKVRLVARVATSGDDAEWVAFAERTTSAALAREVRAVDRACLERVGALGATGRGARRVLALETDEDGSEMVPSENVIVRCTRRAQAKWYHARALARRVAGAPVPAWQCLESVAAEVISGFPLDAEVAEALSLAEPLFAISGVGRAANVCAVESAAAIGSAPGSPAANRCTPQSPAANACAFQPAELVEEHGVSECGQSRPDPGSSSRRPANACETHARRER